MEQPTEVVPVTPQEALFEVSFVYGPNLLKDWSRHSVRTSKRVVRVIRIVLSILVLLYGTAKLWVGVELLLNLSGNIAMREIMLAQYSWGEILYLYLLYPILLLAVGILWLLLDRIRISRAVKRTRAMFGPEPWPVQYRLGEDRFTAVQCGAVQTIPYGRVRKVERKQGFLLLWIGANIIRLPEADLTGGTPEELLAFLREKIPSRS